MVNVTISVTEELRQEMEKLSEVNWSEICRDAIARYISNRKNPNLRLEVLAVNATPRIDEEAPGLSIDLTVQNPMDINVTIDRIFYEIRFWKESSAFFASSDWYLRRIMVGQNSTRTVRLFAKVDPLKVLRFGKMFKETFQGSFTSDIFSVEFKDELRKEARIKIPIDEWQKIVQETNQQIRDLIKVADSGKLQNKET